MASGDTLKKYTDKIQEGSTLVSQLPTQRQAAIDKVKADRDYSGKSANLDKINQQILDSERQLDSQDENTTKRLSGRLITEGQRQRISSVERQPMLQNMGNLSRTGSLAQSSLDALNREIQGAGEQVDSDIKTRLGVLGSEADSLFNVYRAEDAGEQSSRAEKLQRDQMEQNRQAQLKQLQLLSGDFNGNGIPDSEEKKKTNITTIAGVPETGNLEDFEKIRQRVTGSKGLGEDVGSAAQGFGTGVSGLLSTAFSNPIDNLRKTNPRFAKMTNAEITKALGLRANEGDTGGLSFNPVTNFKRIGNAAGGLWGNIFKR